MYLLYPNFQSVLLLPHLTKKSQVTKGIKKINSVVKVLSFGLVFSKMTEYSVIFFLFAFSKNMVKAMKC